MPRLSRTYLGGARRDLRSRRAPVPARNRVHAALGRARRGTGGRARWSGWPLAAHTGHVLVFLPGAGEIRRAQTACAAVARRQGWSVLPLVRRPIARGAGPRRRAFGRRQGHSLHQRGGKLDHHRRRAAVIDSGLARVAGHSPWSGLPSLEVARISQASRQSARRPRRTHRPGPRHAALSAGGFRAPPGAGYARRSCAPTWRRRRCLLRAMGLGGLPRSGMAGRAARSRRSAHADDLLRSWAPPARPAARWRAIRCIRGWRG